MQCFVTYSLLLKLNQTNWRFKYGIIFCINLKWWLPADEYAEYMPTCWSGFFCFFLMCSSFLLRFKYSPAVFVGEQDGPHLLLCLLCLFLPSRSAVRLAFFASEENAQGSQCLPSGQTYFWKKDPVCFNASSDAVWRCPPEPLHDVCLLKKKEKEKKKRKEKRCMKPEQRLLCLHVSGSSTAYALR